jgi:hypothetical protein
VYVGTTNPNVVLPNGCRQMTSGNVLALPIVTSAMGNGDAVFTVPGGAHAHLYAQAWTLAGIGSNGVLLSIGGIVQ